MEEESVDHSDNPDPECSCGDCFFYASQAKKYEGGAQIVYQDKDKSYKVLLTFSQEDGVTG